MEGIKQHSGIIRIGKGSHKTYHIYLSNTVNLKIVTWNDDHTQVISTTTKSSYVLSELKNKNYVEFSVYASSSRFSYLDNMYNALWFMGTCYEKKEYLGDFPKTPHVFGCYSLKEEKFMHLFTSKDFGLESNKMPEVYKVGRIKDNTLLLLVTDDRRGAGWDIISNSYLFQYKYWNNELKRIEIKKP